MPDDVAPSPGPNWARLYVDVPRDLHQRLKIAAATANKPLKSFVADVLTAAMTPRTAAPVKK
jgi:predicted HicB family RNase H-like nuclease